MSKGDKGTCQFFDNGKLVLKTKYDTEKNCLNRISTLKTIGVLSKDSSAYLCKECGLWHMGVNEEIITYSKKV